MKLFKSIILSMLFLINPVVLFGDDRVMIAGSYVWPDQKNNLMI